MKTENKNQKLAFNKANIVELNSSQMNNVKGGVGSIIPLTHTLTTITDITVFSRNTLCTSDIR